MARAFLRRKFKQSRCQRPIGRRFGEATRMRWSVNWKCISGTSYFGMWQPAQPSVRNRACTDGLVCGRRRTGTRVARQAVAIVRRCPSHEWLVRVVAGDARQAIVRSLPAAAALQPKRLRPERSQPTLVRQAHVPECRVTGTAEIHRVRGRQRRGVQDRAACFFRATALRGLTMCASRTMTGLAGHARREARQIEAFARRGGGGVAPETAARFGFVHGPRHGFGQIARAGQRAIRGESEPPDRVVVAHSRLVKPPVEVEEERLPDVARANRPGERRGTRRAAAADRIGDAVPVFLDRVGVVAQLELQALARR